MAEGRFAGKGALVTGGTLGIGKAVARGLAAEGARVALVARQADRLKETVAAIEAEGGRAIGLAADVCLAADVERVVAEAEAGVGPVDILVSNVGGGKALSILDIDEPEWERMLRLNLTSAYLCCRAVLARMVPRRRGSVVLVSSIAGRSTSVFQGAHYTASKAGLLGLSRHLAREMAAHGIRVNAVAPGPTATERILSTVPIEKQQRTAAEVPLGRLGTPEEQAAAILFLASDGAGYITGATLDVNGGGLMI
jgi:NAD(P)-dependent dehydrogenase (short-subunit alcohol dehydrogenase family)